MEAKRARWGGRENTAMFDVEAGRRRAGGFWPLARLHSTTLTGANRLEPESRESAFRPDGIVRSMRNRSRFKKLEKNLIEKVYQLFRILR